MVCFFHQTENHKEITIIRGFPGKLYVKELTMGMSLTSKNINGGMCQHKDTVKLRIFSTYKS